MSSSSLPHKKLYHERQRLALCGVHAVNNLLQTPRYTKRDFDRVCLELSPSSFLNPHRSVLGIGNYDVNVVMMLLQQEGLCVNWHDKRTELKADAIENLVGIMLNVDPKSVWSRMFGGRHWIAFLFHCDTEQWINLDSNLVEPAIIGSHEDCINLLAASKDDAHVLLVKSSSET